MRQLERFPNLCAMFFSRAAEKGDAPFLSRKQDGAWRAQSWAETAAQVAALAASLKRLGLEAGDRVMLVSENRPEWCVADLAIMAAGGVTVPAYTTNTERDHVHILENSGARMAIVSTAKLARWLIPAVMRSTGCEAVIAMEPIHAGAQAGPVAFHDWAALLATPADVAACAAACTFSRDALACLIYTSGTGGAPRGVRQHHGAILHNVAGCAELIGEDFGWGEEVFLSFLPLSHAYEHSAGQYLPIGLGARIHYAESLEKLAGNIEEVKPTIMVVVPRLFELLRARILKSVEKEGRIARWLMARTRAVAARPERGLATRATERLLTATLGRRVRERFGGRMKAMVAGGAPLNPEVGRFFQALGLPVLQGYGQTESGPVISCNRPRVGIAMATVGAPIRDTRVRIAEDGEIMVQGENVMYGYWRNDAETRVVLRDGWLATGDLGHLDPKGRIVITDRKKDLIVNDKGDNIAPQRIEGMLTLEPEIAQAMVSGDRKPYLVGVLVPDPEWVRDWATARGTPVETAAADPAFGAALQAAVDRVNTGLSVLEKVRRVLVADAPFTTDNGQLTPSMKIRRHVLREVYGARLDTLYRR